MTLNECIDYLNSLNRFGSILGLDNIKALLNELKNPQEKLKIIHVTGTNGKGSTCAFLSGILVSAGYKTGMYNSPAVICEFDQFKIDGEIADSEKLMQAVSHVKECCDRLNKEGIFPTRFEVETAAAFVLFANECVDFAIVETGLGGKDDATNVCKAMLHVLTSISDDHIPVLGKNTLEIADNKSHIIKSDAPTVAYKSDEKTYNIIKERCRLFSSPLYCVSADEIKDVVYGEKETAFSLHNLKASISLSGAYQPLNASVAVRAALVLRETGFNITDENILCGIKKTYIPFRFEKLCASPVVIADGAHNPDGARRLADSLNAIYKGYRFIFVTGIFKDKNYEKMCELTGNIAESVFAVSNDLSERSLEADELANILKKYNDKVTICGTIENGLERAMDEACKNTDTVVVLFGSLSWLNRAKEDLKQWTCRRSAYDNSGQGI